MKKIMFFLTLTGLLFSCQPKEQLKIVLAPTKLELNVGETGALKATVTPAEAQIAGVIWKSSNESVATVKAGTVTAVGVGTAEITATAKSDPTQTAKAEVTVLNPYKDGFTVSAKDVRIGNITQTNISLTLFFDTEEFLNRVKACYPSDESAGLKYEDITVKSVTAAENSLISVGGFFTAGSSLSSGLFGIEKNISGLNPGSEYTIAFSMELEALGRPLKVTWEAGQTDTVTTPNTGEILIRAYSDFVLSGEIGQPAGKLLNLSDKLAAAGIEVSGLRVAVDVKINDETITGTEQSVSNELSWESGKSYDAGTELSITPELRFTGTGESTVTPIYEDFPIVVTVPQGLSVSPLEISLNRKSSIRGIPEAKITAQFSYPDMYIILSGADYLGDKYDDYDFEQAIWSAVFADTDNSSKTVTFTDAPYSRSAEADLDLNSLYHLKLQTGTLTIPARSGGSVTFSLTAGTDKVWGDSIVIGNTAEFPEKLYFGASDNYTPRTTKQEGDIEYILVFGDDFNYSYNGLNYKSYAAWNTARKNGDTKGAKDFARIWTTENPNNPFTRRQATWDLRTVEVKNSHLLQKVLAADPANGTIFMGPNLTKPVSGFTDLNQAGTAGGTTKAGEVLTGSVISDLVTYGYMTARVRTKAHGYNDSPVLGPWYAFWAHGPMHEFDIMEELSPRPYEYCNVNHYHNNWGGFGGQFNSKFYNTVTMSDQQNYQTKYWTLGLYWDASRYLYYFNDQPYTMISTDAQNRTANRVMYSIPDAKVINSNGDGTSQTPGNTTTSCTDWGYSGRLKAVPSAPVNIFVSTEAGGAWGGGNLSYELRKKYPTWMEVDYVAYYLPNVEITSVVIDPELTAKYADVYYGTPDFQLMAAVEPAAAVQSVVWTSSDPDIVSIDSETGTVTLKKAGGPVTITATSVVDSTKSDSFEMTVLEIATPVESVSIEGEANVNIDLGSTLTFTATVSPATASVKDILWTAEPADQSVAEIVENGSSITVKGIAGGTFTLRATAAADETKSDTVEITVVSPKAPDTFEAFGITFTKTLALDFTPDADGAVTLPPDVTFENGTPQYSGDMLVVNCGGGKPRLQISGLQANDKLVLVRARYNGNPNAYITTPDSGNNFQYLRPGSGLWVVDNGWNGGVHHDASFSSKDSLYGIYAADGGYGFMIHKDVNSDNSDQIRYNGDFNGSDLGTSVNLVFEGDGQIFVEYIGIYSSSENVPSPSQTGLRPDETITRNGKQYTLIGSLLVENTDGIDIGSLPGAELISEGSLLRFKLDSTDNKGTLDLQPGAENTSYIEVRARHSSSGESYRPHLGLTWEAQFFRNNAGGTLGNGLSMGGQTKYAINPVGGIFSLYGILLPATQGENLGFFFGENFQGNSILGAGTAPQAVRNAASYPFFFASDQNASGQYFDIDYIAFYTDAQ